MPRNPDKSVERAMWILEALLEDLEEELNSSEPETPVQFGNWAWDSNSLIWSSDTSLVVWEAP